MKSFHPSSLFILHWGMVGFPLHALFSLFIAPFYGYVVYYWIRFFFSWKHHHLVKKQWGINFTPASKIPPLLVLTDLMKVVKLDEGLFRGAQDHPRVCKVNGHTQSPHFELLTSTFGLMGLAVEVSRYRGCHHKDKTSMRLSYFYNWSPLSKRYIYVEASPSVAL